MIFYSFEVKFIPLREFCKNCETNGNLTVQGQDYKVDGSKFSSSQFLSSRQRCVWSDGRHCPFYWSILATFPESIASITSVVDSRQIWINRFAWWQQQFIVDDFLSILPYTYTASPSLALIRALRSFVVFHFASIMIFFEHYCMLFPFPHVINLFRNSSILFSYSSDLQMEIWSIK